MVANSSFAFAGVYDEPNSKIPSSVTRNNNSPAYPLQQSNIALHTSQPPKLFPTTCSPSVGNYRLFNRWIAPRNEPDNPASDCRCEPLASPTCLTLGSFGFRSCVGRSLVRQVLRSPLNHLLFLSVGWFRKWIEHPSYFGKGASHCRQHRCSHRTAQ